MSKTKIYTVYDCSAYGGQPYEAVIVATNKEEAENIYRKATRVESRVGLDVDECNISDIGIISMSYTSCC